MPTCNLGDQLIIAMACQKNRVAHAVSIDYIGRHREVHVGTGASSGKEC